MEENQTLRNLLRGVSAFIGEGAGGLLPKMGWDMADFTNFVNRSETDTAWESYQLRKKEAATSGSSQKRPADEDINGRAKKRGSTDQEKDGGYSMLLPLNQTAPPVAVNNLYPQSSRTPLESNGIFSDLMRGSTGSPMFTQPSPSTASSGTYGGSPNVNGFSTGYGGLPPLNMNSESSSMPPPAFPASANGSGSSQRTAEHSSDKVEEDGDPKKHEAYKLVQYVALVYIELLFKSAYFEIRSYHLDNYKRNSAYCLPQSLRPTLVQRYAIYILHSDAYSTKHLLHVLGRYRTVSLPVCSLNMYADLHFRERN